MLEARYTQLQPRLLETAASLESKRRYAVRLVFIIYVLMLVEGPLRKWFLPGLATPLYFIRDPFVVFLYAYCLHARLMTFDGWMRRWGIFAFVTAFVGIIPFMVESIDPRAWILGVRTYWLYMPMTFVIGTTFRKEDMKKFVQFNLLIAIPYSALVILQYRSPPSAWINAGLSGDESSVVMLNPFFVRVSGIFTFTGQNTNFTALLVALYVYFIFDKDKTKLGAFIYIFSGLAICSLSLLTGSRAIYFMIGAIIFLTLLGSLLCSPSVRTIRASVLVGGGVIVAAILFVTVYSDMLEAMRYRFAAAQEFEGGVENRALFGFWSFLLPLDSAPLLGHGIGVGTPSITRFLDRVHLPFGESELMRNVLELGMVMGMVFVLLRFAFGIYLVLIAVRAARAGHPEFLALAGFAAPGIIRAPMTHSSLAGYPYWLAAGLVLVSIAVIAAEQKTPSTADPSPKQKPSTPQRSAARPPLATSRLGRP